MYLAIDIVNNVLVPYNGSATVIPTIGQTDMLALQLQFVQPNPGGVIPYIAVDVSAQAPVVTIASKVTGIEGDEATYLLAQAVQAAFTWDAVNLWYTGVININTTQVATFIGSGSSATAVFEVDLTTGGINPQCVLLPTSFTLSATAYVTGTNPVPVGGGGGTKALQSGVGGVTIAGNLVTLAGLTWGTIPSSVLVSVNVPATKGVIFACYVPASATLAGFTFQLSGLPDDNTYTFTYVPVF